MPAEHIPTEISRAEVKSLASFGVTQEEIAGYIDIDVKTLCKHYPDEVYKSALRANAAVARLLYEKAVIDRDLSAIIFWLKTKAKWACAKPPEDNERDIKMTSLMEKLVDKL